MRRFPLLLTIVSIFVSCDNVYENDQLVTNQIERANVATRTITLTPLEQDIATMLELGLDTTNLLIREDYYMAKGICVYKNVLEEARNSQRIQDRMSQDETIHRHYHKVYYKLPFDSGNSLYQATVAAVYRWGSIADSNLETDCGFHTCMDSSFYTVDVQIDNYYSEYDPLVFPVYQNENTPYGRVVINTSNPLWAVANDNNQYMYLVMHAIGESLKFDSVDTYSIYEPSIMMSEDLLEYHPNLWCDFTANDIDDIVRAFPKQEEPKFVYSWNPAVETTSEQAYILKEGITYVLTISSTAECCQGLSDPEFSLVARKKGSTGTNLNIATPVSGYDNKFNVCINNSGAYELTAWLNDGVVGKLHEQTIDVLVGEDKFVFNAPDTMRLNTAYQIKYEHFAHPSRTVEYSIGEIMFDEGAGTNATLLQFDDNCIVSLRRNGCYVVSAIVKEQGQAIDTAYFNMTKLMDFPSVETMSFNIDTIVDDYQDAVVSNIDTLQSYSYVFSMRRINIMDRFACYVQVEHQTSLAMPWANRWTDVENGYLTRIMMYGYYPIQLVYESIMGIAPLWVRYVLPTLYRSETIDPLPLTVSSWYDFYTGRLFLPVDGFREVKGTTIYDQPIKYIDIPITMQTELGVQSEPVLQIMVQENSVI